MLSFTGSLRIFVALESCDMRKGFNGLLALVSERLGEDVRGGAIFVFANRRHTRLKMLYFDGTGLWLLSKRLESGSFSWPKSAEVWSAQAEACPRGAGDADGRDRPARGKNEAVV